MQGFLGNYQGTMQQDQRKKVSFDIIDCIQSYPFCVFKLGCYLLFELIVVGFLKNYKLKCNGWLV